MRNHARPASYALSRRFVFTKTTSRSFNQDFKPLSKALTALQTKIQAATSLDAVPPFTDIAKEYGSLLTKSILPAYIKGAGSGRTRRYRKNSIDIDEIVKLDWNLQNTAAIAAFSREAFTMAAVQTDELRSALFAEAKQVFASGGTYRDWADTFSLHGFAPENPFQLRTNYDTAANAAYSAGQWEQIQENKALFGYLRYATMQDGLVRDEHAALDGLTFPVDDPFWNSYMPPNGWNCRCSVEQLMESELPDAPQPRLADNPLDLDKAFLNNPGKYNSLIAETKGAKPTNWQDAGLPPWSAYTPATAKLINTDHLNQSQLLDLYANHLGDRYVPDINGAPVFLDSKKAIKFAGYTLADLKGRFKYLNCIDDAIQNPHEAWLNPDTKRIYYLKRYDKNVVLIAEISNDNQIEYFNIMIGADHLSNTNRQGINIHH